MTGTLLGDLKWALRQIGRSPGFALAVIGMLAVGIAANTVVFSGVYALLFRPLPYQNPARVVVVSRVAADGKPVALSYAEYAAWSESEESGWRAALSRTRSVVFEGTDEAVRVASAQVSEGFVGLLGLRPAIGRFFDREEHRDPAPVVVLSHSFWRRAFGSDPAVVGREVRVDGKALTVIGVAAPRIGYPAGADLWTPLPAAGARDKEAAGEVILRLAPGIGGEAAAALLTAQSTTVSRETKIVLTPLPERLEGNRRRWVAPAIVLQIAVSLVLLIGCANVAHLVLARNESRRSQIALRRALGATSWQVIRPLLMESLVLALLAAVAGLALGRAGFDLLRASVSERLLRIEAELDGAVVAVTVLVSLGTSVLFGLGPAALASRFDIGVLLKRAGGAGAPRSLLGRGLAAAQLGMTFVLVASAALMARTLVNLTSQDPGFRLEGAYSTAVWSPATAPGERAARLEAVVEGLRRVPGVTSAGAIAYPPLVGFNPGADVSVGDGAPRRVDVQVVTGGYFAAMGIPLLAGTGLSGESVLVNRRLAGELWPETDPVGRTLRVDGVPVAVAGVVGDVRQFGLGVEPRPEVYLPATARFLGWVAPGRPMTVVIRSSGEIEGMGRSLWHAARTADPTGTATRPRPLQDWIRVFVESRSVYANLMGILGAVGLFLAAVGVGGVVAWRVARRTREIGLRIALGADSSAVARAIVLENVGWSVMGIGLGAVGAWGTGRALRGLLYGVTPSDPVTLVGTAFLLLLVTIVATAVPARRASRVDPMAALRAE